mmetsp:Transcript_13348/g.25508  ORF Transcript_13348/g.25508 Transcript_13348/m.25508 type:complete len:113 (-) Transcript_13348:304-642(-)
MKEQQSCAHGTEEIIFITVTSSHVCVCACARVSHGVKIPTRTSIQKVKYFRVNHNRKSNTTHTYLNKSVHEQNTIKHRKLLQHTTLSAICLPLTFGKPHKAPSSFMSAMKLS